MNNAYLAKARSIISDPQVLSVVAAKRARQLATGAARPMIKCDAANLLDVALLEIGEGLLSYEFGDGGETVSLEADLPTDLPHLFISSVTGYGITALKDLLWQELATEHFVPTLVHRDKELSLLKYELEAEGQDDDIIIADDDMEDIDELEDIEYIDLDE